MKDREQKKRNEAIWGMGGLTPEGQAAAEKAMPHMMQAVKILNKASKGRLDFNGLTAVVLQEAKFQIRELPSRSDDYQAVAKWAPVRSRKGTK